MSIPREVEPFSWNQKCALCLETTWSRLPCSHGFCQSCLKQIVNSQSSADPFPCPTCRMSFHSPPTTPSQPASLYSMIALQEISMGSSFEDEVLVKLRGTMTTDTDQRWSNTQGPVTVLDVVPRESVCPLHKDQKLRFFCTRCSTVICRDCKLTGHEGHATVDLSQKSSEAKTLVQIVTQMSRNNLETKLRQRVQQVQDHQENVKQRKREILGVWESRAEELKKEIDRSLDRAKEKLNQEAETVDKVIVRCLDNMTQELVLFTSLMEHAEQVNETGSDVDVIDLIAQMTKFFGDKLQMDQERKEFDFLDNEVESLSGKHSYTIPDCQLTSFLDDEWKMTVQHVEATPQTTKTNGPSSTCPHGRNNARSCPSCNSAKNAKPAAPKCKLLKLFNNNNAAVTPPTTHFQCRKCRKQYEPSPGLCSHCTRQAQDPLTVIKKAIPRHLGYVITTNQSSEDVGVEGGDSQRHHVNSGRSRASRNDGLTPSVHPQSWPRPSAHDVYNDISTVQLLLSEWQ